MVLDTLQALDASALNALRSLVDPDSAWQVAAIRAFSDAEVLLTTFVLVAFWIDARFFKGNDIEKKKDALTLFYAVTFAFLLYWALNFGLPVRPRPESVSAIAPILQHLPDNSFPSGHGIFAGASVTAAFLLFRKKTLAVHLFSIGVPMLCARILAGVHYPGDVIVGFLLGSIFSAFVVRFLARSEVRKSPLFSYPIRIAGLVGL
ncbi:MAG: undecaprenyl-diphosphatase [Patescibacteria group bacterium]|nr:undecaprenyl-diphosphatase [Patescibacteria group bacterium]